MHKIVQNPRNARIIQRFCRSFSLLQPRYSIRFNRSQSRVILLFFMRTLCRAFLFAVLKNEFYRLYNCVFSHGFAAHIHTPIRQTKTASSYKIRDAAHKLCANGSIKILPQLLIYRNNIPKIASVKPHTRVFSAFARLYRTYSTKITRKNAEFIRQPFASSHIKPSEYSINNTFFQQF